MSEEGSSADNKGHHVPHFHFKPPPGYTGHDMTEPLDLSKIKIGTDPIHVIFDDNEQDNDEEDDEMKEEEEERFTRGRSRSRSVHSNDDDGGTYSYGGHGHPAPPMFNPESINESEGDDAGNSVEDSGESDGGKGSNGAAGSAGANGERKGPLQHREVVALQKGLEEAQQTIGKNSREDEEERMAADAEKRKRMLAANHQAASSSNEPFKRFKLLLLGDSAVGKSSLILRWTVDTFSPNLTSTVGVNFKSKKVQCYGEWIQVQVWDTAGQENFHKITTSYYRGAQGIMLVYDVTEKKSLENVAYWIKNIKAHASESVQIVLVGNKTDLRDATPDLPNAVSTEMGRQVSQKFGVPFFETSAKSANHVEDAFMTLVAAISHSNSTSGPIKVPGSPIPGAVSGGSSTNSPVTASTSNHAGSQPTASNNHSPIEGKKSFFSALRRRSSGSQATFASAGEAHSNGSSPADSQEDPHRQLHSNAEGEGDKEKCVVS